MKKSSVMLRALFGSLLVSSVFSVAGAQEAVKIGAITTLTGRLAEFGAQQKAGFELAVDELNAKGGIGGKKIELVLEDAASDVNKALAAAEKLANSGVGIILNEYSSSIVKPVAQFLSRQKVPNIVVSSSDESITKPGFDYVYRINPPTDEYAKILFEVFKDKKIKSVAILAGSGAFEKSVLNSAMELSKTTGIPVVASQTYDKGLTDFRPILNGFKAKTPDAVMLVGYQEDSVAVMRQAKEVGLNPKVFAGGAAGFALPDFIKGAGSASEYLVTATAWVPEMGSKQKALYDKLAKKLGVAPTYHAAQAYAAVLVAADAIKRAKSSTDREAIRKALDSTNLQTAYAPIKFQNYDGYKNQNRISMVAEQVQKVNGELIFVSVYPRKLFIKNRVLFPTPAWDKRN
ncbi:ABC transporter substrate-binding protein [Deinococcus roseus]|uniref:Branched-chain amino acid ABC transporter substrate-binding protein n=1 Tax=Deinococcus roseus TaxID=392414 RepID=A0ABQ2D231_9DEIO|nr:ABC transporter substrate-binding protein [Deinococcus roseus]GGJ35971.1 branched-chain amino acid ABC transporter substrate-binding protein [Deinococcus roseus]